MREDLILLLAPATLGILLMAYARFFIDRMRSLRGCSREAVNRLLGGEASPRDVEEQLQGLRRRMRLWGGACLAGSLCLAVLGIFLGATAGPFWGWPAFPGIAVFLFSLGLSFLALAGATH